MNEIIDPRTGDKHRAEDIAGELCAVLRKYGYAMIFNPTRGTMVLGKIEGVFGNTLRAIAEIEKLEPHGVTWRTMDWTPKLKGKPS